MQHTRVEMIDDLDQEAGEDVVTHTFTVDSSSYEIDLNEKNYTMLLDNLAEFIAAASQARKAKSKASSNGSKQPSLHAAARAWAIENGLDVPARGRVSATVIEQYQQAA